MCGIAGLLAEDAGLVRDTLPKMVAALAHRGPDDRGELYRPFGEQHLGLGHRRLSVLDLTAAAHQPMVHPGTGSCLVYNGELYNFARLRGELGGDRFCGTGDTEVLLHALERWGPACLPRLEGMFAFAWLDARGGRLVLARDPLGIKPLYAYQRPWLLLFASEVGALLASGLVPHRLDRAAAAGLLAYGAVQQPLSIVESVRAVRPGHSEVFVPGRAAPASSAYFAFPPAPADARPADAAGEVRALLDQAVRDHLVSDVPVGVFLSSGLDSTVLAALASRHTPHLRSFTVGFTDQPDLSELGLAAGTARLLGLEHTEIR